MMFSSARPEVMNDNKEANQAKMWVMLSILGSALLFLVTLPIVTSAFYFIKFGFSSRTMDMMERFWGGVVFNPEQYFIFYRGWMTSQAPMPYDWRFMGMPVEIMITFLFTLVVFIIALAMNPHSFLENTFGSARFARGSDLKAMKLLKGWMIVLGDWKGKFLRLPETLSVLCVAPPGTGKTVAVVVPTILTCDNVSMVVNDVKPELFDITSGYRNRHSFCFKLEWAASDKPEEGVFYPRWNPLSPNSMPPAGANRDLYVDRLVNIVVEEPKGNADPHWSKKGRAVLAGMVHFLVNKVEAGNYAGIPKQWHGKEASLPMLLDWFTEGLLDAAEKTNQLRKSNPMAAMTADPMRDMLQAAVDEARAGNYSQRAIMELTQLANTPDKERGSILSTMDSGLIVFKNSAVRARTEKSDFSFADVRGMQDPLTGEYKPVSIYVCVNQEDARALGMITGLLIESLSAFLVAHKPNSTTRDGKKLGPFPVLFVLDEFPQMPKLQALIDGPAVGRGQKVSYLMIGQDLGQIETKYSKEEVETVISTTAAKVILPLNNEVTAERFSKMVGHRTVETKSRSRTIGMSRQTNPFATNLQRSLQGQPLLRAEDFMSVEPGYHYVLMQGFNNRPIKCKTPMYFKHGELKHLVGPEFGGKIEPAPIMPEFVRKARVAEHQRNEEMKALTQAFDDAEQEDANNLPMVAAE